AIAMLWILLEAHRLQFALPALVALFVFASLRGPWLRSGLGWWPVYCIGAMCYSVYLYHFFAVSALGRVLRMTAGWPEAPDLAMAMMMAIGLPLVLAACTVPYLLFERPFMAWRPGQNRLADAFFPRSKA